MFEYFVNGSFHVHQQRKRGGNKFSSIPFLFCCCLSVLLIQWSWLLHQKVWNFAFRHWGLAQQPTSCLYVLIKLGACVGVFEITINFRDPLVSRQFPARTKLWSQTNGMKIECKLWFLLYLFGLQSSGGGFSRTSIDKRASLWMEVVLRVVLIHGVIGAMCKRVYSWTRGEKDLVSCVLLSSSAFESLPKGKTIKKKKNGNESIDKYWVIKDCVYGETRRVCRPRRKWDGRL